MKYNTILIIILQITYPLSLACTSAPCANRYSTTGTLLKPAAKCSGVECLPSKSRQFTACGLACKILSTAARSPDLLASNSCASTSSVPFGGSIELNLKMKIVPPRINCEIRLNILPCSIFNTFSAAICAAVYP